MMRARVSDDSATDSASAGDGAALSGIEVQEVRLEPDNREHRHGTGALYLNEWRPNAVGVGGPEVMPNSAISYPRGAILALQERQGRIKQGTGHETMVEGDSGGVSNVRKAPIKKSRIRVTVRLERDLMALARTDASQTTGATLAGLMSHGFRQMIPGWNDLVVGGSSHAEFALRQDDQP